MTTIADNTLVLKDAAGNYFLVPQEALELGRASEEQRAEIERLIGEADSVGFIADGFGVAYQVVGIITTPLTPVTSKVTQQDFHFVMKVNKSSPTLS